MEPAVRGREGVRQRSQRPVERLAVAVRARVEADGDVGVGLRRGLREPQVGGRGPPGEGAREDVAQRGPVDGRGRGRGDRVLEVPPGK